MSKAYCGSCPRNDNYKCAVCNGHLCSAQYHDNAICFDCKINPNKIARYPKDAAGNVLHPVTMRPLTMCGCGIVWNQVCGMFSVSKEPGMHGRLKID
jgi:hypothetical protein